jgi:hypothetical protein
VNNREQFAAHFFGDGALGCGYREVDLGVADDEDLVKSVS